MTPTAAPQLDPQTIHDWAEYIIGLCVLAAGGIAAIRARWSDSDHVKQIEDEEVAILDTSVAVKLVADGKDDHYGRVITMLENMIAARDAQYASIVEANRVTSHLHSTALETLRADREFDRNQMAGLREDVADLTIHHEQCQAQLADLRKSVSLVEASHGAALRAAGERYAALARKFQERGGSFTFSDIEDLRKAGPLP